MAKSKKASRKRMPGEPSPLRRFFVVLLIVFACGAVLCGFWWLSKLGPQTVDYSALVIEQVELPAEVKVLQDRSLELEAEFDEVLAIRDPEAKDLVLIEEALKLQEQYVDALPSYSGDAVERQDTLRKRFQDFAAADLLTQSLELEKAGADLGKDKNYEGGREKYYAALRIQKEINEKFPLSSAANAGRVTRLQRQAQFLTAEPLYQESVAYDKKADQFIEELKWGEAESALNQAILLQEQLNSEYRGANQASVARSENLKVKLIGIRSGQSHVEIEEISDLADRKKAEGENLEAAALYDGAARLQRQLNDSYRGSIYASSERVAEFQRKSQTAQSFELGLEIEQNHERLKELLAQRRTHEAAEIIVRLRRDIEQMESAFPRSSLNDEELQVKIRYLNLVQNDLGFVQDRVYQALLPIPNEESWRMLKTEVPQALYSLIMGTNPSRNQGDTNPVDSVSWIEAQEFTERLGWILGKPVQLPTENQFRDVLGPLRYVVLENHVWSAEESDGTAMPIGVKEPFATGYYDLLGNVSEWLQSVNRFDTEDAIHIGGHAQDRLESIFTVPLRDAPRGERNRMTGFRFVVKVG